MSGVVSEPSVVFAEAGDPHGEGVRVIAFDSTGRRMASGDLGMGLAFWENGFLVGKLDLASLDAADKYVDRIHAVCFSNDSATAYVACSSEVLAIHVETGHLEWVYQTARVFGFLRSTPLAIAVAPSGDLIVSSTCGDIDIVGADGRLKARWRDSSAPQSMALLPDGDTLIGVDGHVMQAWSLSSRRRIARIAGGEDAISLYAAPSGDFVVVRQGSVYARYDIAQDLWTARLDIAPAVSGLAIMANGSEMVLIEDEGVTKVSPQLERIDRFETPGMRALSLAYDLATGNVLVGCGDGSIVTWLR